MTYKLKNIVFLFSLAFIASCNKNTLSYEHKLLLSENGIDVRSVDVIERVAKSVRQLKTYNEEYEEVSIKGVVISVAPNRGTILTQKIRNELSSSPDQAYFYDNNYGYDNDEIAIVTTKNDETYLKLIRTDAPNYDLTAEDVLRKYREWNAKYGLQMFGAGRDWIEAKVTAKDLDWQIFSCLLYTSPSPRDKRQSRMPSSA